MDLLLYGFTFIVLAIFVVKATIIYNKTYKGKIYKYIFTGFPEYLYKYFFKKNLSKSSWLKSELGDHYIYYNSYLNQDKQIISSFVTIFSKKGYTSICLVQSEGKLQNIKDNKYWYINRDGKNIRIQSPYAQIEKEKQYFSNISNGQPFEFIIACNDKLDISDCKFKDVYGYKEAIQYILDKEDIMDKLNLDFAGDLNHEID